MSEHEHRLAGVRPGRFGDHHLDPLPVQPVRGRLRKRDVWNAFYRAGGVGTVLGADEPLHVGECLVDVLRPFAASLVPAPGERVVGGVDEKLLRPFGGRDAVKRLLDDGAVGGVALGIVVVCDVTDVDNHVDAVPAEEFARHLHAAARRLGLLDVRVCHYADPEQRSSLRRPCRPQDRERPDAPDEMSSANHLPKRTSKTFAVGGV